MTANPDDRIPDVDEGLQGRMDTRGEGDLTLTDSSGVVPVDEWPIEIDERVLIFVVHENAKYAKTPEELADWQGWCVGYWTEFNKGGWTWHGHSGRVTHVAALPPNPSEGQVRP